MTNFNDNYVKHKSAGKILIGIMICDADKTIAISTINQLLCIFEHNNIGILIIDDSVNHDAASAVTSVIRESFSGEIFSHVNLKSFGFFRLPENLLQMLEIFHGFKDYEFLLKIDPDMFPASNKISWLFNNFYLPRNAISGIKFKLRIRDYVQVLSDILPFGLTRRYRGDNISQRKFTLRLFPIWWAKFLYKSRIPGVLSREIIHGSLMIFPREIVNVFSSESIFDLQKKNRAGLVFGDDCIISTVAKSLGLRLNSIDLEPYSLKVNVFLSSNNILGNHDLIDLDLLHPLKNNPIGNRLRVDLAVRKLGR